MPSKDLENTSLHKPEICAKIAERTDLPLRAVNRFFDTFADVILEEVAKGKTVHFIRVGKFSTRFFEGGHIKTHPVTGARHVLEGRWRPSFKFGETFKRTVKRLRGAFNE